ncbi:FG-GAP-like repeat-containing protein [Arthrobacter sp. HY1533]|uniref:FG-GAP-like repeat-containing protein n=1 Tax=Arthrobacter sp. HY1533 TaxID=2970919 RepID=UPI0022B9DA17|nr:FG-GAP-like repeat-containing protein [Arthrobacter sp. HY1533]
MTQYFGQTEHQAGVHKTAASAPVLIQGVLATLALILGILVAAPPAHAATLSGHDISWPQCPAAAGGFDLPLPPTSTQFVVVGLTKGLPFTENPCLGSQLTWVRTNSKPAQAYTMAAFPSASQLLSYRSSGPWSATTRAGQLSNVGYAQASYAVASLARNNFRPAMVWIDVEPRPAQPWPTATAASQRENRLVIEGLMRGLRDAGFSYGLYSFASGWQSITASWRLPGVPVWATAGRLDYPTEAQDRCVQPSFSGGKVYLSQWYDDVRDYDITCSNYALAALPMPGSSLSASTSDFNGDWNTDVLARVAASGQLRQYPGTGRGTFGAAATIGNGWNGFDALETVGDFSGDGHADVIARVPATGLLWLYRGAGNGGWLAPVVIGNGWNGFDALVGPGDFNGDQNVDLLARERLTGRLWLYPGNGSGGWLPRVLVGNGWGIFNTLVGPGDFNGDGTADVLARDSATGALWLYPGSGTGGWKPQILVGSGWNSLPAMMSPGDFNGDRTADVLAYDSAGKLWLYPRTGNATWGSRIQVGYGWAGLSPIF